MKKKPLQTAVFFLLIILLSLILYNQKIDLAKANPAINGISLPIVQVQSPLNNETYRSNNVTLSFSLYPLEDWWFQWNEVLNVTVILDNETLPDSYTIPVNSDLSSYSGFTDSISLPALTDGTHTLQLTAWCLTNDSNPTLPFYDANLYYNSSSSVVSFNVDTGPKVAILPIENLTAPIVKDENYSAATVALNFTLNKPVSKITYSLDGQANVTIAGNTTLTNLPYGEHNVTVYATDVYGGIGASNTIVFTISQPDIAKPFPTVLIAAVAALAFAAGAGVLIYFKKRTNRNLTKKPP